jgi:hypothetical protein
MTKVAAARKLLVRVSYAMRDGDKALRAYRLARHPLRRSSPERMFCAHRLTYAYRFDRHS